jgi:hypothetical protein
MFIFIVKTTKKHKNKPKSNRTNEGISVKLRQFVHQVQVDRDACQQGAGVGRNRETGIAGLPNQV